MLSPPTSAKTDVAVELFRALCRSRIVQLMTAAGDVDAVERLVRNCQGW
jgi:hypothetical protein